MKRLITLIALAVSILVSCKQETYFNVSTAVQPEGSGTIIMTPSDGSVLEGSSVTFKADPNGDYVFTGWSGSISGTDNPKTVTVTSDLSITANFTLREYPLSLSVEGEGTVSERVISTKTDYASGTVVELTAKASDHWLFDHWEGDLSDNTNPVQITISSPKTVKAVFVPKMYDLTVEVEGDGAVSETVVETKSGTYMEGTVVELCATPSSGWSFAHWEGDLDGNSNPTQITISSPKSVKAVFIQKEYELAIEIQGNGSVNERVIETKSSYVEGTTVELTAHPDEFWAFDHWEGDITGTDNPSLINITSNASVRAVFVEHDPGIVFTETEYISPYEINKRMGMGWNLTCQLESYREDGEHNIADETFWGNPLCTQTLFDKAAAAGFKTVRIPITWMGTFGPGPEYKIDEQRLNRIAEVVGYAEKAGLYAIINMHHDDVGPHDSNHPYLDEYWIDPGRAAADPGYNEKVKEQIAAMWKQIARKLRDKGDFLIFESFNEPGSGFFWSWATGAEKDAHAAEYQCLSEWNQVFVDAVRSTGGNNATRWLVAVGAAAKERNLDRLTIPRDYVSNNRLMLSIHFYEPEDFALGSIEEWGHTAQIPDEEIWKYDEEFISNEFKRYREQYMDNGIPLCVDEIGFSYRDNDRGKAFQLYYYEYLVRAASLNGFATITWQRLFDHKSGEFYGDAEEFVSIARKATYDDSPDYTLESIYDRAPFSDPHSHEVISIPDKVFKSYIVNRYDLDGDGEISRAESVRITFIDIDTKNVKSLKGIEHFNNLNTLICRGRENWVADEFGPGQLTELDVTHNPHLRRLEFNNNHITSIDLSKNAELELVCGRSNSLTSLDISHNPLLTDLDMSINHIDALVFTNTPLLKNIYARGNELSSLDVTNLDRLESLNFGGNHLTSIDLSNNLLLKSLECDNNNLSTLDLTFNYDLLFMLCDGNPSLKTVYLPQGLSIPHVVKDSFTEFVYRQGIKFKDAAFNKYLVDHFDTDGNKEISETEASAVTEIEVCTDNIHSMAGLEHFVNLTKLICMGSFSEDGENHNYGVLSELDVTNNPQLEFLSCGYNLLESLDVSNNRKLKILRLQWNNVTSIDVSNNAVLEELVCRYCRITTSLDFSNNPYLIEIDCQGSVGYNRFKSINVSNCPVLSTINCNSVGLETLDVSHNPQLDWLGCVGSLFTSIDLSANHHLKFLGADVNSLSELDLTQNPEVEYLYIQDSPKLQYVYLKTGQTIPNIFKDDHTQIVYK